MEKIYIDGGVLWLDGGSIILILYMKMMDLVCRSRIAIVCQGKPVPRKRKGLIGEGVILRLRVGSNVLMRETDDCTI
jgi:hypothetical protein